MSEFEASPGEQGWADPLGSSSSGSSPSAGLAGTAEAMRPMNLGEILDRAVQMLRSQFLLFAGIAFFPAMATLLHTIVSEETTRNGSPHSVGWRIGGPLLLFVFWLTMVILGAIAAAVKCRAASEVLLGKRVTIRSAYGAFSLRVSRLVGMSIWIGLLVFWPLIPAVMIAVGLGQGARGYASRIVVGLVVLAAMIPSAALYARYALAFPATAIEDATASDAIKRSVELGRGYRWKVFWSFALPMGIGMAVGAGGGALLGWMGQWHRFALLHPLLFTVLLGVWAFAASLLYEPLISITTTLAYYDLRVRKEGFDIVQMIEKAGLETVAAAKEPA